MVNVSSPRPQYKTLGVDGEIGSCTTTSVTEKTPEFVHSEQRQRMKPGGHCFIQSIIMFMFDYKMMKKMTAIRKCSLQFRIQLLCPNKTQLWSQKFDIIITKLRLILLCLFIIGTNIGIRLRNDISAQVTVHRCTLLPRITASPSYINDYMLWFIS